MVNVSNSFLIRMKKVLKANGHNIKDCVICFVCNHNKEKNAVEFNYCVIPLYVFEDKFTDDSEKTKSLPFEPFALYKKSGCWLVSNNDAFFHLINKKITLRGDKIVLRQTTPESKNSFKAFLSSCVIEYAKNEKISRQQLAANLQLTSYKLRQLYQGKFDFDLRTMLNISREMKGENKVSKYGVMIEKFISSK